MFAPTYRLEAGPLVGLPAFALVLVLILIALGIVAHVAA
jgi:hypothetical protein